MGRARYPHAAKLLITADCGGSNGVPRQPAPMFSAPPSS